MIDLGTIVYDLQKSLIAGNPEDITQLLQTSDGNGMTLLHWATVLEYPSVVRELLRQGADKYKETNLGLTARDIALMWDYKKIADMLN